MMLAGQVLLQFSSCFLNLDKYKISNIAATVIQLSKHISQSSVINLHKLDFFSTDGEKQAINIIELWSVLETQLCI